MYSGCRPGCVWYISLAWLALPALSTVFFFTKPDKYDAANKDELSVVTLVLALSC